MLVLAENGYLGKAWELHIAEEWTGGWRKSEVVLVKSVQHVVVMGSLVGSNVRVTGESQGKGDGLSRGLRQVAVARLGEP